MLKKIIGTIISIAIIGIIALLILFKISIGSVSNDETKKDIFIEEGMSYMTISSMLKENNLINSELFYKIYIKLNNPQTLETGKYELSESMSLKEIIDILSSGSFKETVSITFKEGKNMRYIASLIEKNTTNTEEDVFNLLKDNEYIDSLIEKYWFLTDDIKDKDIYYPLEGYLFPDTYEVYKDSTVKEIFEKMLDEMEVKIEPFKEDINSSSYSIHEIMTLASIVELEGASSTDRKGVAGVFYNRLSDGWILGSDVTTYYASKIDDWNYKLTNKELNNCNPYNTRANCFAGLPIGPICNPGLESLKSVFEPEEHNYYYFVADCDGKTYLSKNESQFYSTIRKLQNEDKWCDS